MKLMEVCLLVWCSMFAISVNAAPVAQSHQIKGLTCESCHTQMPFADYNKCIACHGGRERLSQSNPQHSAMKTADVPCVVCHKGHQER